MSGKKGMNTKKLLKSFLPYYGRYKKILIFDLLCAALTTLGELILPLMLRYITNQGMQDLASMTAGIARMPLSICRCCPTAITATQRWDRLCRVSPVICLT